MPDIIIPTWRLTFHYVLLCIALLVMFWYVQHQVDHCPDCQMCMYCQECRNLQEATDRLVLYGVPINISKRTAGIADNTTQTIVLWANRTKEERWDTEVHERCHILAWSDPQHFCGWYNKTG